MLASLPQSYGRKLVNFSPNTETHFITEISKNDQWKEGNYLFKSLLWFFLKLYVKEIGTFLHVDCCDLNDFFTFNCDGNFLKSNNLLWKTDV